MREKYESLSLSVLKELAKTRGLKGVSLLRKPELIERMLEEDEKEKNSSSEAVVKEESEIKEQQQFSVQTDSESEEKKEKIEEKPEGETGGSGEGTPEGSDTGDTTNVGFLMMLLLASMGVLLRKRKEA